MVKSNISQREVNALKSLNEMNLNTITVPYRIEGSDLYMEEGRVIEKGMIDMDKLYDECLSKMYRVSFSRFSSGFYAFWGTTEIPKEREKYGIYLSRVLKKIPVSGEWQELYDFCNTMLNKHIDELNGFCRFHLLHGDLHLGNILLYKMHYKLIDFEFMRVGPIEIELVFLFYWSVVCSYHSRLLDKKKEFDSFVDRNQLNVSKQVAWDVFLPLLLLEGWKACGLKQYKNSERTLYGIKRVWEEYKNDLFD